MTEPKDIAASTHTVRVAAVQIAGRVGDLADNLQQAEALATEALARGAKVVVLPEFFTTPCYVHQRVHEAIVGLDNPAKDMLVRLARQHGAFVGGSMLMRRATRSPAGTRRRGLGSWSATSRSATWRGPRRPPVDSGFRTSP